MARSGPWATRSARGKGLNQVGITLVTRCETLETGRRAVELLLGAGGLGMPAFTSGTRAAPRATLYCVGLTYSLRGTFYMTYLGSLVG